MYTDSGVGAANEAETLRRRRRKRKRKFPDGKRLDFFIGLVGGSGVMLLVVAINIA